jgi:hypothetical protein
MATDQNRDYDVGYGKPPDHTRFQKGRSGNPRGSKNLSTQLNEALNERVLVAENRRRRKITKQQAMITQLVNKAAQGDWRALKILLDILQAIESRAEPALRETSAFSAADEKVIAQLKARFARSET